ncbi:MAG: response regulator [Thermodesulfobacteriota bacterium]
MKNIRVLLVDDHQILREGLLALLGQQSDIEVVTEAGSGQEAVRKAQEVLPDVVIMDISMRDMDGIVATRKIKAVHPHIQILCLSVHREGHLITSILEAGAQGYICKSSPAEELMAAVRTVASGQTYLSPSIAQQFVSQHVGGIKASPAETCHELTKREKEILQHIAQGYHTGEIADRLSISPKTVLAHRHNIMVKLEMDSTVALARYAMRQGIIGPLDT